MDGGRHFLGVACESGVLSVFDEQGRALRKVAEGFVETGAHSVAVNQRTHEIYLPLANVAEQPVLRIALLAPPRK